MTPSPLSSSGSSVAEADHYRCSSCDAEFQLAASEARRCPQCLRSSGIVLRAQSGADEVGAGGSPAVKILLAALVVGAVGAGTFFLMRDSGPPGAATPAGQASDGGKQATVISVDAVPQDLQLQPAHVDGAVRLAADGLPRDAAGVVAAVTKAVADGLLPVRGDDDSMWKAPRSAGDLAPALGGRRSEPAGTLERAHLAAALLEARGLGPVSYGVDDDAPGSATDITRRRYLVQADGGGWLAVDAGSVPATVRPLTAAGVLADTLAWRALGAVAEGDADMASRASQQARALAPDDPAIAFIAGQVQIATGLAEMGLAAMERAAGQRSDARTWYSLGLNAAQMGSPFKAQQYFEKAADADPTNIEPHILMAHLTLGRLQVTPKEQRPTLVAQIERHLAAAAAIDPKGPGIATIRAQLRTLEGDSEGAEALLREELQSRGDDPDAWMDLADFLEGSKREVEAMEVLTQAVDKGVEGADLFHQLGAYRARDGDLAGAAALLERALAADPGIQPLRPQLAQIDRALGQIDKARGLLVEHVELFPSDLDGRLLLAQFEMDQQRWDDAKNHIEFVLGVDARNQSALTLAYLLALQRKEGVEPARKAAVAAFSARTELAQILLEQGFPEEGELLLREALVKEPEDGLGPVLLATVLLATGRAEEAQKLKSDTLARVATDDERTRLESLFDTAFQGARASQEDGDEQEPGGEAAP